MDARFDSTSSMTDFKYMPLNSPDEVFTLTSQCGEEFDPHIYNYPNPPQQNFPQQLYDLIPPFEHTTYPPEETSDSDSGIHSPQPITLSTGENPNCWTRRPNMQVLNFFIILFIFVYLVDLFSQLLVGDIDVFNF